MSWTEADRRRSQLMAKSPLLNQTFLNDLEPSPANIAEAASLVGKLIYRPDEPAQSGPVFNFCIKWMGRERVALMTQTAIVREGRHIKWHDDE